MCNLVLCDVLDDFNRQALAIEIGTSLSSERLARVFDQLKGGCMDLSDDEI